MKKIFFVLIIVCTATHVYAQEWALEYSLGYGTYQLDDVKSMQDYVLEYLQYQVPSFKETDRFPGYITHTVALGYIAGDHHFGLNFSYLTTGGRLNTADYSGSYTFDMIMNGYRLGAFYKYYIRTGYSPLSVYLQLSPGVIFSNLKFDEKVRIGSESSTDNSKYKSTGMYVEPTIGVSYQVNSWAQLSLGGGYEADFWGKLKLNGQETQYKAHWDGLRLYASVTLTLPNGNQQ